MYLMNRGEDNQMIEKYHRAKDMIAIHKFFPGLSPVDQLAVVVDEEDYQKNKNELKNLTSIRNGNPVAEPCMESIPVREMNPDFLEIMKEIKKVNPNGVLILFHLDVEKTERYERYAGISVGVSLGNFVYIDAVGQGFDGREVLKGISCHERYSIPWSDLRVVNLDNWKSYRTYLTDEDNYQKSRKERIHYLESCGLDKKVLEEKIPKEYSEIPDFIWMSIIRDIIKGLEEEEDVLRSAGYLEFNLSGHTEGRRFAPWQMADSSRM